MVNFSPTGVTNKSTYQGTWFHSPPAGSADKRKATRLPADGEEANRIVERAHTGTASIESIESETQRMAPPALYDLTELQRHANRLFGFSAQKTLDTAQALYERHKLISYPRTDSRHLSKDVAGTLQGVAQAIEAPYREHLASGTGERPLGRRFIDDSKVTDHHAIIPTTTSPERANLSADERKIYDLICRRLLSAWHDDHIWSVTTVITAITNGDIIDRYHTSGTAVQHQGWKVLDVSADGKTKNGKVGVEEQRTEQVLPPDLAEGQLQEVVDVEALKKKTRPPKHFTEATLLTAMETAGKTLDEKELSEAMKESGLGTPATRAAIIELLLKRGYLVRDGRNLEATDKGVRLIDDGFRPPAALFLLERSTIGLRAVFIRFHLLAITASVSLFPPSASAAIVGVPSDAVIVETQSLPVPNRSLVLWMIHPTRHEDTIYDGAYTCPDQTMGHYLEGPTRVSLVNTALGKVINTVPIRFDWGKDDKFFVPYRIARFFYSVRPSLGKKEGKPQILSLRDVTGLGEATQFALFDAQNCSIVATSIYGFSKKTDTLVQYPFDLTWEENGKRASEVRYWLDHFAVQKPAAAGQWKYSIDYNSGDRSTYEIHFDREREVFVGTVVTVPIR